MRITSVILILLAAFHLHAQISGNSSQGSADSKEFIPVGSKEQTGQVDLFSGTYGEVQKLGTVSTPTGLSFTLNLSYSSTPTLGQNMPFIDGIPYGEGWNLNLPFISISTASMIKYSNSEQISYNQNSNIPNNPDGGSLFTDDELKNNHGHMSWFSPYLNIPGVASGKLVFKYMRENKGKYQEQGVAIFVLERFETYVEAAFDGVSWLVTLPDGTEYSFNEILYTVSNSTNQRVARVDADEDIGEDIPGEAERDAIGYGKEVRATNKAIVENLTQPKKAATSWYISKISNNSKHYSYYIAFHYSQYGKFNFHKNNEFLKAISPSYTVRDKIDYMAAPRELFLNKILAVHDQENAQIVHEDGSNATITEYLELVYEEDASLASGNANMVYTGKTDCSKYDDLYMKEIIYKRGGTAQIDFNGWKRYRAPVQFEMEKNPAGSFTPNSTNLFTSGTGINSHYVRKNLSNSASISFDHGFLESVPLNQNSSTNNKFMPGGEVYEVEAIIGDNSSKFCLFDINITSLRTNDDVTNGSDYSGYDNITEAKYSKARDNVIFSTFDQAEKFKVGLIDNSSSHTISQFFTMPVLPSELSNFVFQIGPANSDNDFSLSPTTIQSNTPIYSGNTYYYKSSSTYFNNPDYIGNNNYYRNRTALKCPQNFGGGFPWYMMYRYYEKHLFPQTFSTGSYNNPAFVSSMNTWWGDVNTSPNWGNSSSNPQIPSHIKQATLTKDIFLANFVVNRYSKRPYVLKAVKHYVINATPNTNHTDQTGGQFSKTFELNFKYSVLTTPVYACVIASTNSFPPDEVYNRYVIVLSEVVNVTDNSAANEKKLKIRYTYTPVATESTDPILVATIGTTSYYQIEKLSDVILLTKVQTASGSMREIEYYNRLEKGRKDDLTQFKNYDLWNRHWARVMDGPFSGVFSGPTNTYQMAYVVKEIKDKVSNSGYQLIKYNFENPVQHEDNLFATAVVGDGLTYYCEFLGQSKRMFAGFQYAYVDYGNSTANPNLPSNKVKYTFNSSLTNGLRGKLLSSESYKQDGTTIINLNKTEYVYDVSKAYQNGFTRWNRLKSMNLTISGSPNFSRTPKNTNVALEYDYSDYNASFLNSSNIDVTKYYTVVNISPPNTYLNKSITDLNWDLWTIKLDQTLNMNNTYGNLYGIPVTSQKNSFRDYTDDSYFIKLKQVKTTDFEKDASLSSISVTTIKDFEYYDADYSGLSTCKGFAYIKDDFTSSNYPLMYEPSWQLYSVKEYSASVPNEYTLKENFYYYDLIQQYNVANLDYLGSTKFYSQSILGTSYYPPYFISERIKGSLPDRNLLSNTQTYGLENFLNNGLEALCNSQYYGVRNLLMEERVSTSSKNGNEYDDHYKSTYYLYKKSDKEFGGTKFDKSSSFMTYSSDVVIYPPQPSKPRFKNFAATPAEDKPWNKLLQGLIPYPVKKLDDPVIVDPIDKAIAMYLYTGGYNKDANNQHDIFYYEALVEHCFSDFTPVIDSSGQLFKLTLQNVMTKLNLMYNTANVPRIDTLNSFDIGSDESVYNEFHRFTIEDFISLAIKPAVSVSNQNFFKLLNLEYEATKALMCYAIQDSATTINSIINSMPDDLVSQIAYLIITQKNLIDVQTEKLQKREIVGGCKLPPYFIYKIDQGPPLYHLQPDKIYTQIDDGIDKLLIESFPSLCATNSYVLLNQPNRIKRPILHFKVKEINWQCNPVPQMPINDKVEPVFPYAVLKLQETTDINIFGNVSGSKNELDLETKSIYPTSFTKYLVMQDDLPLDPNNPTILKRVVFDVKQIGMPSEIKTIGDGHTYTSSLIYDNLNRVTHKQDDHGLVTEIIYDGFSNIVEKKVNGTTRVKSTLSFWNFRNSETNFVNTPIDPQGDGSYISKYNYIENLQYVTSNSGISTRNYYEPTGRLYQTVIQDKTSIDGNSYSSFVNYSGLNVYDKWGRVTNSYKPFSITLSGTWSPLQPDFNPVDPNNDLKISIKNSDDLKSKIIEQAPYGRTLGGNNTIRTEYYLLNGNSLLSELGLVTSGADNSKIKLIMLTLDPNPDYSAYKFYKTISIDPDLKTTISYTNIWGQLVATLTSPTSNSKSITINGYNNQGLLKQTISPIGVSTYYKYNWQGNLIEKVSADAGIIRFMYDQSGNVVLEQSEKMRAGEDHVTGYYRGYIYDKRNRLIKQYVAKQYFDKSSDFADVTNPSREAALKRNLPLTTEDANENYTSQNFQFIYQHDLYENLNTYVWLYKKPYIKNGTTINLDVNACLGDKITEREWFYDEFPISYENYFHSSICNTGTTNLKFNKNHLLGKLALDVSYNSDFILSICPSCSRINKMVYMRFFSYDIEGNPEWEIQQFNENGISASANSGGLVAKIDYLNYTYNGTLQTKNVYLLNSTGNLVFNKQYHNTYDSKNRLSSMYMNNNISDLTSGRKMVSFDYNPTFGFNESIKYYRKACNNSTIQIDNIDYLYTTDPQNRLTKISNSLQAFSFELFYDNNNPTTMNGISLPAGTTNFNGNINATVTKYPTGITNFTQNYTYYGYTYDGNNRLTSANGLIDVNNINHGDENFTYDLAGNILTLNRSLANSSTDAYSYIYTSGTNLLDKINNQASIPAMIRDYNYDKDGNTTRRQFTGGDINPLVYGRSNLPFLVTDATLSQPITINYLYNTENVRIHKKYALVNEFILYDITGTMLSTINRPGYSAQEWFVKTDKILAREDVTGTPEIYNYIYDHLGNTKLVYKVSIDCMPMIPIVSFTYTNVYDYFPYGKILRYNQTVQEKVLITGNERDKETGGIDGLDYRIARIYDCEIGRFLNIDPLTEYRSWLSSYNYVQNNPILRIDPNGSIDDWVMKDNEDGTRSPVWDDRVIDQPSAIKYYGLNALYLGKENQYTALDGREINLNTDKTWTDVTCYRKSILAGQLMSDDISQNRIAVLERGSLNNVIGIVLHRTESSSTAGTLSAFSAGRDGINYGTHFLVGKDGLILQTALLSKYTLHVGKTRATYFPTNRNSIGIEVVGKYNYTSNTWESLTPIQIEAVARLTNYLMVSYKLNSTSLFVHEQISYKTPMEGGTVLRAIQSQLIKR